MTYPLTTEQLLLLNNLMYLPGKTPFSSIEHTEAKTVGEWVEGIDMSGVDRLSHYGFCMTGRDLENVIGAVRNDDVLMNMQIAAAHVMESDDSGGGGVSAVFENPVTGEAVVAFRGTAPEEWRDNFAGGTGTTLSDGVSTMQQWKALEWYRGQNLEGRGMITVTGHSKGGNKAQYIALLDDSVSRCVSFDGQGFSDQFMEAYRAQVARNQYKIANNSVRHDYVNPLLNAVGRQIYYEGYDYGKGGFLENHCPNTFFFFDENGNYQIKVAENGQAEGMRVLRELTGRYLRSLTPESRAELLAFLGETAELALGESKSREIPGWFFMPFSAYLRMNGISCPEKKCLEVLRALHSHPTD